MGQCLSWALGLLLPSLWEAEVAISATALLIAALILFLLTSDQHAAKSTAASGNTPAASSARSSATAAAAGRGRTRARGEAASEITCAQGGGGGGYVIKVTILPHGPWHLATLIDDCTRMPVLFFTRSVHMHHRSVLFSWSCSRPST